MSTATKREKGGSLVAALMVAIVIGGAAATSLQVSTQRNRHQANQNQEQKAFAAAEAGIDNAIALANAGQFDSLQQNQSTTPSSLTLCGATDSTTVERLTDTVNGNNTTVTLRVMSTGVDGSNSRKVVGFIRKITTTVSLTANIPAVQSAMMLSDPFANVTFNGNSFLINGDDQNINGTSGPGASVWGMGVGPQSNGQPGSVTGITSHLSSNQYDNVTGSGPDPSVGNVSAVPISTIISTLSPYADVTLTNVQGTYTGSLGNYATNTKQLTKVNGDIHISGGNTGYGILIVNGNLTISGNWQYVGMVFVNGQVTFSGGGNTKKLTGACFVAGNVQDLIVSGNIQVQYSSEAIANIINWLGSMGSTTSTPYSFVSSAEMSQ